MITFKEFLLEKKMSTAVYTATFKRLEDDAKIGFEIEVFVPTGTFFHETPAAAAPIALTDLKTMAQIQMYFNVSSQVYNSVLADYTDWAASREDAWIDDNWETFVTDEEARSAEKDARLAAAKSAKTKFTWLNWVQAEFKSIAGFAAAYKLEPKFGWVGHDAVYAQHHKDRVPMTFKSTAETLATFLEGTLKQKVTVNGVGYDHWNLTHDTTIKDTAGRSDEDGQDGIGVELVSPPLPPSQALKELAAVLNILDTYGIETNESTGIHVNISLSNMDEFDPLKLVLFMGDEHVLKKFNRAGNAFTNSQIKQVIDSISLVGKVPRSCKEIIELGRQGLAETGKYYSVNLRHLPKYLEFRAAGGTNYHRRLTDIQEVVGRWLTAVELAAHPEQQRQEYLKKVMKLIDRAKV